jgi:hypothetical protein
MASLYERLMGIHADRPKIPVHQFQAIAAEWAKGQITSVQAQTAIATVSRGVGLDATEQLEAQDLVATVPTGGTTANQAARALRLLEIDEVLLLADRGTPPYDTAQAVRTRLGVPTR